MLNFNITRVNLTSPYTIEAAEKDASFVFSTDFNVAYVLSFEKDFIIQTQESYQLSLTNANRRPSPSDPKLKQTIIEIIYEYFRSNNYGLVYICETGDNKQQARNRIFQHWFNSSKERENYVFLQGEFKDEEGNENYGAVIIRKDNPNLNKVIEEFNEFVTLFSQKPNNI